MESGEGFLELSSTEEELPRKFKRLLPKLEISGLESSTEEEIIPKEKEEESSEVIKLSDLLSEEKGKKSKPRGKLAYRAGEKPFEKIRIVCQRTSTRIPGKLKEKRLMREKLGKIPDYDFFKISEEDPWIYVDEESYSGELNEKERRGLGLKDREVALYEAIKYLYNNNWKKFLKQPIIRHMFAPIYKVIGQCGKGGPGVFNTRQMFYMMWDNNIDFYELDVPIENDLCYSCKEKKFLTFEAYTTYEGEPQLLGYLGSYCRLIRLKALNKFVDDVKHVAIIMEEYDFPPNSTAFQELVFRPIQDGIEDVKKASKEMDECHYF